MTKDQASLATESKPDSGASSCGRDGRAGLRGFLMTMILVMGVGAGGLIVLKNMTPKEATTSEEIEHHSKTLTDRVESLEQRVTGLETKSATSVSSPTTNDSLSSLKEEWTHMKKDIQTQIQKNSTEAERTRATGHNLLAGVVAFTILHNAAATGMPFEHESRGLHQALGQDDRVRDTLSHVQTLAATGAPTMVQLAEALRGKTIAVENVLRQDKASGWKDVVMAEVRAFVSVRPLQDGEASGPLGTIMEALAQKNLKRALEKIEDLPAPAREILKDWRAKAESRRMLNEALEKISSRLLELAQPSGEKP